MNIRTHFLPFCRSQSAACVLLLFAGVGLLIATTGCGKPVDKNNNEPAQAKGSNLIEYRYSELHSIENFELTERNGKPFGTENLKGKVWLASFFFSRCKSECTLQNQTISSQVHEKLLTGDFTIVSFTCDPTSDTPSVLTEYAREHTIDADKWKFVTGPIEKIQQVGDKCFKVVVDPLTHTKRLLLVDKWGRFRDSFEWKDPKDLKRLVRTAKMLMDEEEQPSPDEIVRSRAIPDDVFKMQTGTTQKHHSPKNISKRDPSWPSWRNEEWLTSFELTDSNGKPFRSDEMKGKVWVANFFFSNCTGACPKLLNEVKSLREQLGDKDVTFVSVSNDPKSDTPKVLKDYARRYRDDADWYFLTGQEQDQIRAIGSEFFDANAGSGQNHSEKLIVVDKWGKVRGYFKYNNSEEMVNLRLLLDDLLIETEPPKGKK